MLNEIAWGLFQSRSGGPRGGIADYAARLVLRRAALRFPAALPGATLVAYPDLT